MLLVNKSLKTLFTFELTSLTSFFRVLCFLKEKNQTGSFVVWHFPHLVTGRRLHVYLLFILLIWQFDWIWRLDQIQI